MQEVDKDAVGQRLREIRVAAGLRQRELADRLGTSQSAIHKYERGVIPEPRRLIWLADLGETTVDWILTGRHPGGRSERRRVSEEALQLADRLDRGGEAMRAQAGDALAVLRAASDALRGSKSNGGPTPRGVDGTARLLEAAAAVHDALVRHSLEETRRGLVDDRSEE